MHGWRASWLVQLLALALAAIVLFPGLALGDNLTSDGDGLAPVADSDLGFGAVCKNVATTKTVLIAANRNGSAGGTQVYKDGSNVTVTGSTSSSGLSITNPASTIAIPSNWGAAANNTKSPAVSASVTLTATSNGPYSGTISWDGTGVNSDNNSITRSDNMVVSATVSDCDTTPPDTVIDTSPSSPTNSTSASFTYHSTEGGTSFLCSLDGAAFASCPAAGISYTGLGGGSHTFQVEAKDAATNIDPSPASFAWSIDLAAPNTSITGAPDPITNQTGATFTYSSTEADSSFQCSLDGAAFAGCPAAGKSYSGLGEGAHTFQVKATDAAGNTDASPAAYGWTIDLTPPSVSAPDLAAASDSGTSSVDNKTSGDTPTLNGTADAGSTLELLRGAAVVYTTTTPAGGTWSFTSGSLTDGSYTFKARATDAAGNSVTSAGLTVLIDATAPSLSATATKADLTAYTAGTWSKQSVTVTFACTDSGSGVDTFSGPETKSADGADQSASGSCSDVAGNSAITTFSDIDIDTTAPAIALSSRTPANGNGWNNAAVTVVWDCSDALSGPASPTTSVTKSADGANQTASGTCSDNAGNSASANETGINIDTTAPVITFVSRTPAANAYGWNNSAVTVVWGCSDALSGAAAASVSDVKAGEGSAQTALSTCLDLAGNSASATKTGINIDLTDPTITYASRTPANSNGWNNSDVEVTWDCADALSGVLSATATSTTSIEGENQTASSTCYDKAGNSKSASVSDVNVDTTPPTITLSSRTPANGNGWNNSAVTVTWTCTDGLSGVVAATVSDTVSSEGANQTASATCEDEAGNTASDSLSGINIDLTAPVITFASRTPVANSYGWNTASVTVVWSCSDALSGPAAASVSDVKSAEGAAQTASGTCVDLADNSTSATKSGINIDLTDPIITFASRTAANGYGWNNSAVTVTWDCTDALAGVVDASVSDTKSEEGAGQTASDTCADQAGNSASDSLGNIDIDLTDPTITFNNRTPVANGYGWNNTDVAVAWDCADALSGAITASVSDTLSDEGADQTASGTCQDKAGNAKSADVTGINIDTTDPTITLFSRTPANGNGWNNTDVTVVWDCADAFSGVVDATVSDTKSSEGAAQTAHGTCQDEAGNGKAADETGISIDKSDPTITLFSRTPANAYGWNMTDVTVEWTCGDLLSGPVEATSSDTKTAEGAGQTASGLCSDLAGNSAGATVTGIKIDKTAPAITFQGRTPANGNDWNNGSVTVVWDCADSLSGVVSATASQTLSSDGANQSASGICYDKAGNSKGDSLSGINIDTAAPTITFHSRTPANTNGWNNTNVTVVWDCADPLSGTAAASVSETKTVETSGATANGTCYDLAGNSAGASLPGIKIDKTAPSVVYAGATTSPNGYGWYDTDVTAKFHATDDRSGFDTLPTLTKDANATTSGEGSAVSVGSPAFTDQAGNTAAAGAATSSAYKIDKTAPVNIQWSGGPAAGGSYYFGSVPGAPECSASDALSGVDYCGVTGYGTGVGAHTMTATADDKAGNEATATRSYTVLAWTLKGFYQPVDMSGVWNTVKSGSTVPLKWEMYSGSTKLTDVALVQSVTAAIVSCGAGTEDAIEEVVTTTGNTVLRYDGSQFIDNWQTPKRPGTCYRVTMTAVDGTKISALFKLK